MSDIQDLQSGDAPAGRHSVLSSPVTPKKKRRKGIRLGPLRLPLWFFLVVVVLVVAGGVAFAVLGSDTDDSSTASGTDRANALIVKGLASQTAGDLEVAQTTYLEALDADPNNARAHYNLGTIYQSQDNTALAITEYEAAVRLDATMAAAYYNLGIIYADSDPTHAIAYYRQAVKIDPQNASAHLNLGFLLRSAGQDTEGNQEIAVGSSLQQQDGETTTTTGATNASTTTTTAPASTTTTAAP